MANGHYVIPKLVEDTSLKRARVVDGNGDSYIRVTGTVTSSDLDPIKEALGEPTDTSSDNTVIGLLKKIDVKQFGVGQAYPGSTGGEIFNYYGTDSYKNVASGSYSTARGLKNTASGNYSLASGQYNTASGSTATAMGNNNTASGTNSVVLGNNSEATSNNAVAIGTDCHSTGTSSVTIGTTNTNSGTSSFVLGLGNGVSVANSVNIGQSNTISAANSVVVGTGNTVNSGASSSFIMGSTNTVSKNATIVGDNNTVTTKSSNMLIGRSLHDDTVSSVVILGQYNNTPVLSSPKTIIASGSGSSNKANALECNKNTTKICNNLQLATNSYEVNDITAPLSSPASTDDKTLATKAYVDANAGFTPQKQAIYAMYVYSTMDPPIDFGEVPYQSGRVVLKGNIYSNSYGYGSAPATFEARFDLTDSPKIKDSEVQQTVFSYDSGGFTAITLTIEFAIDSSNHLIVSLAPATITSGIVFYDTNRVAQGRDYQNTGDIYFDMMSSFSYFYNY